MIWDQATINELRALHASGVGYIEIGRRLGCSKGTISGKVSRLELKPRPSPIIKGHYNGAPTTHRGVITTEEQERRILLMTKLSDRKCAEVIGVSRYVVNRVRRPQRDAAREAIASPAQSPCQAVMAAPETRVFVPVLSPPSEPCAPARALPSTLARAIPVTYQRAPSSCCWPIGHPGTKTFRFCDAADVIPGKPYCLPHAEQAYIRVKPRMEG
jgi:GcrA cell cycle regulator